MTPEFFPSIYFGEAMIALLYFLNHFLASAFYNYLRRPQSYQFQLFFLKCFPCYPLWFVSDWLYMQMSPRGGYFHSGTV